MSAQFYLSLLNPLIALSFSVLVALLWQRMPTRTHFFPLSVAFLYLGLAFISQDWPPLAVPGGINYAGNAFFFSAVVLACVSAIVRVGAKVPIVGFGVITLAATLGFLYFSLVTPSTLARILLLNACFATITVLTILRLIGAGLHDLADQLFVAGIALGTILAVVRPLMMLAGLFGLNPAGGVEGSSYWGSIVGLTPLLSILVVGVFVFALVLDIVTQLKRQADHDYLTGLFNRRGFESSVGDILWSDEAGLALLVADIDDFKQVNDGFGHAVGDRVIATVASVLSRHGQADIAGRMGGEEFALFYRGATNLELERIAQTIASELNKQRVAGLPGGYPLTISIGLHARQGAETLGEMQVLADRALYRAKEAGKNRAVLSPAQLRLA